MENYSVKQKSYPNQKGIIIHKPQYKENFLQVAIEEWQEAFIRLHARSSLGLYLYLCSNADGYLLSLSSADVQQRLGISDSSYRRAVEDLLAEGFLIIRNGNIHTLDFYTTPQPTDYVKKERKKKGKDGGAAGAASASTEASANEVPAYAEPPRRTYDSSSRFEWEEN